MRVVARDAFHWEDLNLIFQKRTVATLIPHATFPSHWHLKFEWRDTPTPEFFNIFNARENCRLICRKHYEETAGEAPLTRLNEEEQDMCHLEVKQLETADKRRSTKQREDMYEGRKKAGVYSDIGLNGELGQCL